MVLTDSIEASKEIKKLIIDQINILSEIANEKEKKKYWRNN